MIFQYTLMIPKSEIWTFYFSDLRKELKLNISHVILWFDIPDGGYYKAETCST
jgi:hypothetical protein